MPLFRYHGKDMKQSVGLAEMSPVFTLILIVVVGILLRRLHVLSTQDATSIRKFVFNVSLPALTFISLYGNPISLKALWLIPGVIAIQTVGYLAFRIVPVRYRETVFSGFLGNTGFMGYPVVQAILGQGALPLAVIYEQTHSFMVFGVWVHKNARSFINPPLVAMLLALILKRALLPQFFTDACKLVGNSTSPLAMLFVGLNVELDFNWRALIATGIKLALVPAMALALTLVLPVAGDIRSAFIIQSAMPTMVASVVYGAEIGLDVQKLSRNVVVSTLLFPLTILFWARFL
ncbi:MAG: AEC family transporter [Caldiserica bacterium]|nr:AEC family transporter [Caldisericota bacterium]